MKLCKMNRDVIQKSEREIMSSFAFKKNLPLGASAHSSMSETMALDGEHVVINYVTEFDGVDLKEVASSMRTIKPQFSNQLEHARDVQIAIDENYINSALFNLFYNQKTYSLTETIIEFFPEDLMGGLGAIPIVNSVMNTQVWQFLFPDLKQYSKPQKVDFRCVFSKDYLQKGKLSNSNLSQIFFRDGNKVDLNLNFGCGMYVFDSGDSKNEMQMILEIFQALNTDASDPSWKNFKSFFISMQGLLELDFSANAKKFFTPDLGPLQFLFPPETDQITSGLPLIFGRVVNFTLAFKEVKVFNGDVE